MLLMGYAATVVYLVRRVYIVTNHVLLTANDAIN